MNEIINKKFVKRAAAIFIATVLAFVGVMSTKVWAANSVYSIWVPSEGVDQIAGIPYGYRPTNSFTIADGDTRFLLTLRVEPKPYCNPSHSNVILQKNSGYGWSNVGSDNIPADNKTYQPFGVMSVSAGTQYRVICNCVSADNNIAAVDVIAVFASYTS